MSYIILILWGIGLTAIGFFLISLIVLGHVRLRPYEIQQINDMANDLVENEEGIDVRNNFIQQKTVMELERLRKNFYFHAIIITLVGFLLQGIGSYVDYLYKL